MRIIKCIVCGKEVKQVSVREKRFCSAACRASSWRIGLTAIPCFYCGCPANTIDHVPPKSVRSFIVAEKLRSKYTFSEVNCCLECNVLLGDRPIWRLSLRKRFIKRALRLRYARLLRGPIWTTAEKNVMGYNLKVI